MDFIAEMVDKLVEIHQQYPHHPHYELSWCHRNMAHLTHPNILHLTLSSECYPM